MADKEILIKKIDQIDGLLNEMEVFLARPFDEFVKDIAIIRATERSFQLLIDTASDINGHILVELGNVAADSYRQTFTQLAEEKILPRELEDKLVEAAKIRNILVHEYDFEEDYEKFYTSAKELLPTFREYARVIYHYIRERQQE